MEELTGKDSDFVMTVLAEEYFQTKRIRGISTSCTSQVST